METEDVRSDEIGGQMSFMGHLDELRRRLVNSVIILVIAFTLCWFVSDRIYDFLVSPDSEKQYQKQKDGKFR